MKKRGILLILLMSVLLVQTVFAEINIGNRSHEIEKNYIISENLRGWINISLNNVNSNYILKDNLGNSITLLELLKINENINYRCSSFSCEYEYTAANPQIKKEFSLSDSEKVIIGLKIEEFITNITSISFSLNSSAGPSCKNQIEVDIFNNNKTNLINNKKTNELCPELRDDGCYDEEKTADTYFVGVFPNKHCQRVMLQRAAGFRLGAWLERNGNTKNIVIGLFKLDGSEVSVAKCNLPTSSTGQVSCAINYTVIEPEEYYVCVYSTEELNPQVSIRGYPASGNQACGFYGEGIKPEIASFNIFALGNKFNSPQVLEAGNTLPMGFNIAEEIKKYLLETYGNFDCSLKNCIIPIKIKSNSEQRITIENLKIDYETTLGRKIENRFYDLSEIPSKINMNFSQISIDVLNFSVPGNYGTHNYTIHIDNKKIFEEEISVEKKPEIKSLNTRIIPAGFPYTIKVSVISEANITEYLWKFGESETKTTYSDSIEYTYESTGNYTVEITVKDANGLNSSKIFEIEVIPPKEIVEKKLEEIKSNIENISKQLDSQKKLYKDGIKRVLKLEEIENELMSVQRDLANIENEEEYIPIARMLMQINIPKSVSMTKKTDSILIFPSEQSIDLGVLQEISEKEMEYDYEKYTEGIFGWYVENIETTANLAEFSGVSKEGDSSLIISFIEINVHGKKDLFDRPFLIINNLNDLSVTGDYYPEKKGDSSYIILTKKDSNIVLSTTDSVDLFNPPFFISPELSKIPITKTITPIHQQKDKSKWKIFIIIIIILIFVFMGVYIFMQEWYKKKYEDYLFKNKNNLINLLLYIKNSKREGNSPSELKLNLKKAGWDPEQTNYALRKYHGERTGMVEIPVEKIINLFKPKEKTSETMQNVRFNQPPPAIRKPPIIGQPKVVRNNPVRTGNLNSLKKQVY